MNNVGMNEMMARILNGCNATSYMISSGLCFWLIERCGRRVLMLSGLSFQCLAYVMVAISIALLDQAPFQASCSKTILFYPGLTVISVGNCCCVVFDFLLRSIRLHLGYGPVDLPGRDQLSRHENYWFCICNRNELDKGLTYFQ